MVLICEHLSFAQPLQSKMCSSSFWSNYSFCSTNFLLLLTTLVLGYSITYLLHRKKNGSNYRLPPGPPRLPILGNLHMLGDLPHRNLCELSKKYGPMMFIRLGLVPAVVISSPEMAELFLKTHDIVFASRPKVQAAKYMSYDQKGMAFTEYGSYWRNVRKFCTLHLFTNLKFQSFRSMRRDEVMSVIKSIKDMLVVEDGRDEVHVVDVSEKVWCLVEDVTFKMVFGAKAAHLNFKSVIHEAVTLAGAFNVADYVPYIEALDLQGFTRRLIVVRNSLDEFFEKIIEDAKHQESQPHEKEFIDVLLSLMDTKDGKELDLGIPNIKAIILDMIVGGMDTSATAIEWAFSELLRHPRVMKLVQKELESVVGLDRMVEETDLDQLEYLDMVVKESMRLHPVAPLLVPRECREDIKINDYDIPKKARLIVNIWAIGRDPKVWSNNVEEFYPERFMNTDIDLKGHDFRLIPFGSGRRGCPGIQLGLTMVQLILAQLIHCFNWELPNGMSPHDLDMTEKFGLSLPRANHLHAVPTYRLNIKNL